MSETAICRLCARQSINFIRAFEKEGRNLDLVKRISQCLQILLSPDDALPKEVCNQCCDKLNETSKFHECCSKAQQYLISLFSSKESNKVVIAKLPTEDFRNDSNSASDYIDANRLISQTTEHANLENINTCQQIVNCVRNNDENKLLKPTLTDLDKVASNASELNRPIISKSGCNEIATNVVGECIDMNEVDEIDDDDDTLHRFSDGDYSDFGTEDRLQVAKGERKGWSCYECTSILPTLPALKDHYTREHNQQPVFKCTCCTKVYNRYRSYARHIKTHDAIKKYSCDVCGKRFTQRTILKAHSTVHSGEKPFSCKQCGKTFKQYSSLFVHLKTHASPANPQKKLHCTVCPKLFTTKQALSLHLKSHSGERDFVCDICGRTFLVKSSFDYHLTTHEDVRPHVCHVCGKTFRSMKLLTKHGSVHTGVKPHQCDVCGKQFRERSALTEHSRVHTGAMPYSCTHCTKRFRFKSTLTVHLRQHTGERPYHCSGCTRVFTNWANLNKHTKRKHKNDLKTEETSETTGNDIINEPNLGDNMAVTTQSLIRVVNDKTLFGKPVQSGCEITTSVQKGCGISSTVPNGCGVLSSAVHNGCEIQSTVHEGCEIPSTHQNGFGFSSSTVQKGCEMSSIDHKGCEIQSIVHKRCEMPSAIHKGYEMPSTVHKRCEIPTPVNKVCEIPSECVNLSGFIENTHKMSESRALVNGDSVYTTQNNQYMPVTGLVGFYTNTSHELQYPPNQGGSLNR